MQAGFNFNKIYVIQSLESNERKTGEELHNDLLRWQSYFLPDFESVLNDVSSKQEFFDILDEIKQQAVSNGIQPIIHLEMHGSSDKSGLILNSKELIKWSELYSYLMQINVAININLFLTLAVCHGGYLMSLILPSNVAPFWGFIGSFDIIYASDLSIRYNEFYTEFFKSFDIQKAFSALKQANPSMPADYRFISAEETFKNIYTGYFRQKFTSSAIRQRFDESIKEEKIKFTNRDEKQRFYVQFQVALSKSKMEFYYKHSSLFFLYDLYPSNKERFLKDWSPPI